MLRMAAPLLVFVACAPRVPTEAEIRPLEPIFERITQNPAGAHAQLEGHDLTFRGQVLKTGIANTSKDRFVTSVYGDVAVTKRKTRTEHVPYVILYPPGQPAVGAVICYVSSADELTHADVGRILVASGDFKEIDTSTEVPAILLTNCRVFVQ